jgi:hypothetical protein
MLVLICSAHTTFTAVVEKEVRPQGSVMVAEITQV